MDGLYVYMKDDENIAIDMKKPITNVCYVLLNTTLS